MKTLYQDTNLTLDEVGITIRGYYFPHYGARRIPWRSLRSVDEQSLTWRVGKYRIWGMGLQLWWFNCDVQRGRKSRVFVLDTGSALRAAITPDEPEKLREALRARGFLGGPGR